MYLQIIKQSKRLIIYSCFWLPNVHRQLLGLVQEPPSQVPTTGKTTAKVFLLISQNHLTDDDYDDPIK